MSKSTTRTRPTAPAQSSGFDPSSLTATDAELPRGGRTGKAVNSPFVGWLRESQESGKGKAVTVPGANVREVVYLIRAAATHLNIGSRIVVLDSKGEPVNAGRDSGGKVVQPASIAGKSPRATFTVQFAAKKRRGSKSADKADATE